jgi:hypothetical protein
MTKEEKAVLEACDKRFDLFMQNFGYKTPQEVIKSQRGHRTPQANLIRAVAKWRMARDRPSCPKCGETELTAMGNCPNGCDEHEELGASR